MQYDYRSDFPIFGNNPLVYIDNAATAQKPEAVIDAVADFYERHNANPLRGLYSLSVDATEELESARAAVCGFIGASSPDEIVFTRNTTESINLVAYSYGLSNLHAGDEVVVSITEHHSNLLPWQFVCKKTGATLKFIECEPDGSIDLDKVEKLIYDRTALVAVAQVSNVLGRENPVGQIAKLAHRVGAVMVVDGAQSTPHMHVDVGSIDADFFAFSGHKMYGPMGIGVLYAKRRLLDLMPPFLFGGEMIDSVKRDSAVFSEPPHKFEAGTVNVAGAVGLHAAIDYVSSVGFETIGKRELEVSSYAMTGMLGMKHVHVVGSHDPAEHNGIITFTVDDVHPHDVSEILAADNVAVRAGHHCAQPLHEYLGLRSTVRASFAFYNTIADADKFLESLSTVRERMGYGN